MAAAATQSWLIDSPYHPDNEVLYREWRERKLEAYPQQPGDLVVEVRNPAELSKAEAEEILRICRKTNMVIYRGRSPDHADKSIPRSLGKQFGLTRLDPNLLADDDGITSLQVMPEKSRRGYIPYTDRRLLWHTDGYYNTPECRIRALIIHCVSAAAEGGENSLLDHEILYLLLRDADPDYIHALMQNDVMTIPANTEGGGERRPAQTGPVFSIEPTTGSLHMRYTHRARSIEWRQDERTRRAVAALKQLLTDGSRWIFKYTLKPGEGVLSNNVLHNRSGFRNDPDIGCCRLLYRARYYDRIAGTESVLAH